MQSDANVLSVTVGGGTSGDLLTDPCAHDYELEVDESTDPITIAVRELRPSPDVTFSGSAEDAASFSCIQPLLLWQLEHQLEGAPGNEVIDASNGQPLEIREPEVIRRLQPDDLPSGWFVAPATAAPALGVGGETVRLSNGVDVIFIRSTFHPDPRAMLTRIRNETTFIETTVQGSLYGELSEFDGRNQLRFVDDRVLYQLFVDDAVDASVLVEVAEGMALEP